MRRVLLEWRGITIHAYPALLFVGIVAGVVAGTFAAASLHLDAARTFAAMLLLVIPALVGSRVLYVAANWRKLSGADRRIWRPVGGGAALYGGLILSLIVSWPLLSALALPLGGFWDAATITLLVGMIFTRIGCLLNGCCGGRCSQSPLALYLPNVHGVWRRRLPSQLFEAGLAVVLLIATIAAWDHSPFGGAVFLANLAAYGCARFMLETTREANGPVADGALQRGISLAFAGLALGTLLALVASGGQTALQGREIVVDAIEMNEWQFLLAPLAVASVLLLFGFVGCHLVFSLETIDELDKPYTDVVTADSPAAWLRLQEVAPTSPDGGTANDEIGGHPGAYTKPATGFLASPTTGSIGSPSPAILNLGADGLLATEVAQKAIQVLGGFVRVSQGGNLLQGSFSIELLTSVEFNLAQPGFVLPVLSCRDPAAGNRGLVLYAGPDPNNPSGYSWHLRAGTGNGLVTIAAQPLEPRPGDTGMDVVGFTPTYLVLTYEAGAASFSAYYYYSDRETDWLTYVFPLPAGAGPFVPADTNADLLIGIDQPPIAQVQALGIAPPGPTSAGVALTFVQTTTRGNLLMVAVALNPGGGGAVNASIADTFGNTWKLACRSQTAGVNPFSAEIWYAENCIGGVNHAITVTPSGSAFVAYSIAEYSGVAAVDALDQNRTGFADSANPSTMLSSGALTTSIAGALYAGVAQWGGVNLAATTQPNWTGVFANTPTATTAAISVQTFGENFIAAPGDFAATWTLNAPQPWAACLATFRPGTPTPFQGKLAEVAFYSQVLTAERVMAHGLAAFMS